MADTLIAAGRVVPATGAQILSPGFVRVSGGVVTEVGGDGPAEPRTSISPTACLCPVSSISR